MSTKASRVADFRERAETDPSMDVLGTKYVTIHPFADDRETLERLNVLASSCSAVDAYWLLREDVAFVQVIGAKAALRPIGRYVRFNPATGYVSFVSIVADAEISRSVFEYALRSWLEGGAVQLIQKREGLPEVLVDRSAIP